MPKLTVLRNITLSGTGNAGRLPVDSCVTTTISRQLVWDGFYSEPLLAKYKPFELKVATLNSAGLLGSRDTYFGEFQDVKTPEQPLALPFSFRKTAKGKMKQFIEAKKSGQIVLRPLHVYTGVTHVGVGCWRGEQTGPVGKISVEHQVTGSEPFPYLNTGCPSNPFGRLYGGEFYIVGSESQTRMKTNFNYDIYTINHLRQAMTSEEATLLRELTIGRLNELTPYPAVVTSARAEAASAVLDVTTTLAEAPELLASIMEAIRLILAKYLETRRSIKTLKRNKINSPELASDLANLWLQYRYAIMPNVYTIEDSLEYLESVTTAYQSVRTGGRDTFEPPELNGWRCEPVDVLGRCFIKNRFDMSVSKPRRFLGANLATTAWELVPLSFVIDWVLNIGDFIAALSSPSGSVQEACMFSWATEKRPFVFNHPDWIGSPVTVEVDYYRAELIEPLSHLGILPQFDMSWKRWLDATALSWGAFKGSFQKTLRKLL